VCVCAFVCVWFMCVYKFHLYILNQIHAIESYLK